MARGGWKTAVTMIRARLVLVCLSVLVALPAVAGARPHRVRMEQGEIAITYEGDGETNIPTGYQCVGTNPCTSFGSIAYTLHWEATAIVDRRGFIHGGDTTLDASGSISVQPNAGLPAGAPPAKAPSCDNSVRDRRHYVGGVNVALTRRSVGVQAELPFSRRWLVVSGDPNSCQLGPDTWAGSVFSQGLESAGPQSDADAATLQLALRPKMGARRSVRKTTKHFDFTFDHDTGTGPYGVYVSKIRSSMTIINGCKLLDLADGNCLSYSR
jgi:hypothetical protein